MVFFIDGGARGNPGLAGYGVRVVGADGSMVDEIAEAIGVATNNVAEYRGLLAALEYADAHGLRDITIRSDSELLVRQMRGEYRVRNAGLRALHAEASRLVRRIGLVHFEHVRRRQNAEADALANKAMDQARVP
ncbi:MAG: ribonuclease HI family protein [Acidobacteriota bacterium]